MSIEVFGLFGFLLIIGFQDRKPQDDTHVQDNNNK